MTIMSFSTLNSKSRKSTSKRSASKTGNEKNAADLNQNPAAPLLITIFVFIQYGILLLFAYLRDFIRSIGLEKNRNAQELSRMHDFVPLYSDFEALYTRNIYMRLRDCFNRPISSTPGREMSIMDWRTPDYGWTFQMTGEILRVTNYGSYNYLGFAQNYGPCPEDAAKSLKNYGIGTCSSRCEFGNTFLHQKLDDLVAEFLNVEAACCLPMGFATNSMNIGCLADKNSLILSDELNHASIVLGCRLSRAVVKVFHHNDLQDLERNLRKAIVYGQPRTRRPFKKILICVEGIYSMEGTIVNLPGILALAKKYKAYVFLDEAHSIGAIGKSGRGVCEYYGIEHKNVDILMGTFTKSFASAGGYIAGRRELIDHLRANSHTVFYGSAMSPPLVQQILTSMSVIMGRDKRDDGLKRLQTLARNTRYLRAKLSEKGFTLYGHPESPVVPVMIYFLSKITYASRWLIERGVGMVVVGFPATSMTTARARLCLSASHTKEDLDKALEVLDQLGGEISIKHNSRKNDENRSISIDY